MATTLFRNVRVFDGTASATFAADVLVTGNRITQVSHEPGTLPAAGHSVVEGGQRTLMPGLVEPHSHLTFPSAVDRIVRDFKPAPERHQFYVAHNAKVMLDHGFTSAFSGGATRPAIEVAVRDEIAEGWIPGPRLKASSFERAIPELDGKRGGDLEELEKFVTEMTKLGVDSLKLIVSGRGAMEPSHWKQLNYGETELSLVSRLAAEAGLKVTGHAYTAEAVKLCALNGFHAIYHCNFADTEALDLIEERKDSIFVAPCVGILVVDAHERFQSRAEAEAIGAFEALEGQCKVIPEMHKRGIRVLPGGDYGFPWNPVGRNARDIEHFVTLFGLSPAEALRAATQYGGQMMGMGNELGLVKEGYLADLLLVDGDPVADVKILQDATRLNAIMKEGVFHKAPAAAGAA